MRKPSGSLRKRGTSYLPEEQATWQARVEDFDRSDNYRRHVEYFIQNEGVLDYSRRKAFATVRNEMVVRVLQGIDILLCTSNNSGTEVVTDGFEPTILICDDTGQVGLPAFCVPLISSDKWRGLIMFGDPNQLEPICLAGNASEVSSNTKLSPLALLDFKHHPHRVLNLQYWMCPPLVAYPSEHYYKDIL